MEIIVTSFKVHDPKEGREEMESSITLWLPCILYFICFFNDSLVVLILYKKMDLKAQEKLKNPLKVRGLTLSSIHISHCLHPGVGFSSQVNGIAIDWRTPLYNACLGGNHDCVTLLLDHGAAPHPESDLASPIHEAAKRGKSIWNVRVFTQSFEDTLTTEMGKKRDILVQ